MAERIILMDQVHNISCTKGYEHGSVIMKDMVPRTVSLILIMVALMLFFGNIGIDASEVKGVDFLSVDAPPELNIPIHDFSLDPNTDANKDIDVNIESITIDQLTNGMIFPNTPVVFDLEISGPKPKYLELWLDSSNEGTRITYDVVSGQIEWSNYLDSYVSVDQQNITLNTNKTNNHWNARFPVTFKWEYPRDMTNDVFCIVRDRYGSIDSRVLEQAYRFEADLVLSGEPQTMVDDERTMTDDGYLKGGINLKISQLSIHFEGARSVSPDPEDIEVGVIDDKGKYWPYFAPSRSSLNNINFAIPVPTYDDDTEFRFKIMDAPINSQIRGSSMFNFYVDSTPPSIGDFRYRMQDDRISVDWAYNEIGSGLRTDGIQYRLRWDEGTSSGWRQVSDLNTLNGRLSFDIPLDQNMRSKGDVRIAMRTVDRVDNRMTTDHDFFVGMDPTPEHDIALDGDIHLSQEIVIVNQITQFRTSIVNRGTSDESDIPVEIMRNGQLVERQIIPFMAAGSRRELRWEWLATEGESNFVVNVDPYDRIQDEVPENNRKDISISSDYLDVYVKEDYLFLSDDDAKNMELITLHFGVRSIGSVPSGPITIIFKQDNRFMGTFQIDSIDQEGSRELTIEWKVDQSAKELILEVDPYNEILESMEENNRVSFENPFFIEPVIVDIDEPPVDPVIDDVSEEPVDNGNDNTDPDNDGGTIWSGPVVDQDEILPPPDSSGIMPYPNADPEDTPSLEINPMILPTIGTILGTASVGLTIAGIRNEILRFKFIGLLIPLYSKIKKSKIDKGVRHEILGYLKAKPGANYSELKRNLDLNDGSLVHHLRVLEREEKVYSKKMGKYKLFYVTAYRRESSIADYISPLQMRILDLINKNPGIVPKKLSKILDRSQTDMSYHLSELSRNGLLEKRKKGRHIHYYLSDEFSDVFA